MKTVLAIGADGFIGSHLVERFLADGWHVKALSFRVTHDQSTPSMPEVYGRVTAKRFATVHAPKRWRMWRITC